MANDEPSPVSPPRGFVLRMAFFLTAVAAVALVLYREIATAFLGNPGLNGLILGVLALGIFSALQQVMRLVPEARWANAALAQEQGSAKAPRLLAPLATILGEKPLSAPIAPAALRRVLDSIGSRLDEARDLGRYLTGLLIFLGLLGTFWGLVGTVGSIGDVVRSMQPGTDSTSLFEALKTGLGAPIAGMGVAFSSSLFGLAGSLVLGFLELQASGAQDRFLAEVEDAMTAAASKAAGPLAGLEGLPPDLRAALEKIAANADHSHARATMVAVADLADGVQKLVSQMRSEQQLIREWVEAQSEQGREIKAVLDRLAERAREPAE